MSAAAARRRASTRPSEHIFAVSSLESIRAQPRAALSDLNGHTARNRLSAARYAPIARPTEPATPDANALRGQPAPRPLAGPILPLVASSVGTDQSLGGPGSRPAAVDALAARVLVKGETLSAPAGRADDSAWPRREVRRERAKDETPVASASSGSSAPATAPAASLKPKKHRRQSGVQGHLWTVPRGMAREPALAPSNVW
jgi:uncharacterized protein